LILGFLTSFAAFGVVAGLDRRLSDWDPASELSRLGQIAGTGTGRAVSSELGQVLALARAWAERTDGAFDPTVGPLTRLWRWSARRQALPDSARLAAARAAVGWRFLRIENGGGAPGGGPVVHLERPGMALDLGGIAKGVAADAALAELARRGIHSALVDAGGDLALGAAPPGLRGGGGARDGTAASRDGARQPVARDGPAVSGDPTGQPVALDGPRASGDAAGHVLILQRTGVATSGARYRSFEVDGVRYGHIVDPRTGLGVTERRAVTVIARDAATADVLASALSVLDEPAGRALLRAVPGARRVDERIPQDQGASR
ncbi:MAG: FAD:protein FMN transferase, partial [Gemmatimonadota bacterium]